MNDADGRAEAKLQRAPADGQRVLRIVDATTDHGINVHVKVGVLGQHLQLLVQNLQAFLRDVIRIDVINRNLQPFEAGFVEALDAIRHQQISIGDHSGDAAVLANAPYDLVQLRMQQRLAATNGDHGRAQLTQLVHTLEHQVERHRFGEVVVLVAVLTGQVAAAHRDQVRQQRMIRGEESPGNLAPAVNAARKRDLGAAKFISGRGHYGLYLLNHIARLSASF